jgi:glutathione S-transferase
MSLTLHYHPLSSFCQKVLIGLYELEVPFEKQLVDLGNEAQRTAFYSLWPIGKFPVLHDAARDLTVPETSIILEYVEQRQAKTGRLIPTSSDDARECRLRDRFFDLYVNTPLGKIVTDKLRPAGQHDPYGVAHARAQLGTAYAIADGWLREGPWAVGRDFSMADCAAAPALFFANKVLPFMGRWPNLAAYFTRLEARPSVAQVLNEAEPYLAMFPG